MLLEKKNEKKKRQPIIQLYTVKQETIWRKQIIPEHLIARNEICIVLLPLSGMLGKHSIIWVLQEKEGISIDM